MKNTGDIVHINGKEYILGDKIGGGFEGSVFAVESFPGYVIKIIGTARKTDAEISDIHNHLVWLRDTVNKSQDLKDRMAYPKALLDDELGYIMTRAKSPNYVSLKEYLDYPTDQQEFFEWCRKSYNLKKRLQIIATMFHSLERIHISGMLFTDLSPNNIMVSPAKNSIVFIDTDNMRHRSDTYVNVLGTEGYMAPEMYHTLDPKLLNKADELRIDKDIFAHSGKISADSDVFSAAIIAFQLLTLQHPYIGDMIEQGSADEESEAYRCATEYILTKGTKNRSSQILVNYLENEFIATKEINRLFGRTFIEGKNNPHLRPTAKEFYEAFSVASENIARCPSCGVDTIVDFCDDNKALSCWYCEKALPPQTILRIYTLFEDYDNREKLVDDILGIQQNDSGDVNVNGKEYFEISKVTLIEGEGKYLYLRHFENADKRSTPYAHILLKDMNKQEIEFRVLDNSVITDCSLVEKASGKEYPMNNGKGFHAEKYYIKFDVKSKTRVGIIKTIGVFDFTL